MTQDIDDIEAKARRTWEEIISSGDPIVLPQVMHADCVDHSARPGEPHGVEGATRTMRWLHSVFSDLKFDIHHVIGDDDTVAVHCTLTGRHTGDLMGIPPTNRPVATPMVHILRFPDGKAAEHWRSTTTWQRCASWAFCRPHRNRTSPRSLRRDRPTLRELRPM